MEQQTIVLTNSKGKKIPFITHQDDDELIFVAKRGSENLEEKRKLKIYTIDIDKLNKFRAIEVEISKFEKIKDILLGVVKKKKSRH